MSWPNFYAPSAAWLFLLAVPLIILYFLKLRRPLLKVPSLALWAQVMKDQRVNSPFQRFRKNLLLWLQLLLLCLLVLAAMLPFVRGGGGSSRVLLILDNSASMGALDKVGGRSRLDLAKERALDVINGLSPSQQAAILTFGHAARRLVAFTSSKRVLRDAVARLDVDAVEGTPLDALRMADAMARREPFDRVLLFSDGNFPGEVDFDLPFDLEFEALPAPGPNLGIAALRARRNEGAGWSVFVRVEQSPGAEIPCTLVVEQDQAEVFREAVHPGSDGQRFVFEVPGTSATALHIRLIPRGFDALAIDNDAWLSLRDVRPLRVLVGSGLMPFEHALRVTKDVEMVTNAKAEVTYDLVISRGDEPMPQAQTSLRVGAVPGDLSDVVQVGPMPAGTDTVVDWERNSSLLEHVEMAEIFIGQRCSWVDPDRGDAQLDSRRYEVLAYGEKGPLIVQKEDAGLLRFHMLFDPARSTLPYRVAFPILCRNLVTTAMMRAGLLEVDGPRTGVLPPLSLLPDTEYEVTSPKGEVRTEQTDALGQLRGVPATAAGIYTVSRGGEPTAVGVSLLSSQETVLRTVRELQMRELKVAAETKEIETDQALWAWLAGLALLVLMLEWWVFQARPGGYVRPSNPRTT